MHDVHARPPDSIRGLFKAWRKRPPQTVDDDRDIIDPSQPDASKVLFIQGATDHQGHDLERLATSFLESTTVQDLAEPPGTISPLRPAFEIRVLPGLYVFPFLLTPQFQIALLEKLLHRDLSNPVHATNLHLHYDISHPKLNNGLDGHHNDSSSSFFGADQGSILHPKDSAMHKPITYAQMLESKLRWMTLGGQYDWTNKVYPDEIPPTFPPDIATFLKSLFPTVDAQAAIVNFYSPGDTLSVHRDVSEECNNGLISISLGCDGVFIAGNEDGTHLATLRLRSGDVVLMSGESRYAWHGVPKILPNTCPEWLRDWPNIPKGQRYEGWEGWMANKRINLNVRQMTDVTLKRP
ncbi:alkylated DNA repair protein AlkB [Rhinocladiella mackenziei CBS 650.93]|uniref:mRNA N(6)-methyladenine demethylase n=1 Tax=Rhinocladiella mackenziei CBS 650.93 TaxID=1442369 RepID=A0A0D2IXC1_9EURO|nr:alkylated DNA repair protein AlkB [Rhinocladiella mackenziei CBS 650.93]KIX10669.1 alkylated DNA repair protein AlkB [Rhinocladiella mackenziei CBS 650.93]